MLALDLLESCLKILFDFLYYGYWKNISSSYKKLSKKEFCFENVPTDL